MSNENMDTNPGSPTKPFAEPSGYAADAVAAALTMADLWEIPKAMMTNDQFYANKRAKETLEYAYGDWLDDGTGCAAAKILAAEVRRLREKLSEERNDLDRVISIVGDYIIDERLRSDYILRLIEDMAYQFPRTAKDAKDSMALQHKLGGVMLDAIQPSFPFASSKSHNAKMRDGQ